MEEKKKRVRATLTQVRALEKELEETRESLRLSELENRHLREELDAHMDGTSAIVADCDGWRDEYYKLENAVSAHGSYDALLKMYKEQGMELSLLRDEYDRLLSRGLWARIRNK